MPGDLYAQVAKCQPEEKAVAAAGIAGVLIIAPPGEAQRQAFVFISDAEAVHILKAAFNVYED